MQRSLAMLVGMGHPRKLNSTSLQTYKLKFEVWLNIHCPEELCDQCLVEYLLHGDLIPLAPCHGDSRIQVVDLGGAKSYCLEIILDPSIDFSLLNDNLLSIYACLDPAAFKS